MDVWEARNVLVGLDADTGLVPLPLRHDWVHDAFSLRAQARPVHIPVKD